MWSVLILVLALGLGTGCDHDTSPEDDGGVYSYNVEELVPGLLGAKSPTMTMNEWYMARPSWTEPETYDSWSEREKIFLYQDKALEIPFAGSDIINENTIIYCDHSFNGQGKKTGEITGTITLTDIPLPDTTKVYINSNSFSGYPSNWWSLNRKIDMSGVTGTSATLDWSLPVYESLQPNSQATFQLIVLPGDSLKKTYTVQVSTPKTIDNANANAGDLGTVSVNGVTLSGTITVTHNGLPVPYIEIYAQDEGNALLGITCLSSPQPNAPWSLTFGMVNTRKTITFHVFGYSEKNETPLIDKYVYPSPSVYVDTNRIVVPGIVLDLTE